MINRRKIDRAERARRVSGTISTIARVGARIAGLLAAMAAVGFGLQAGHRWLTESPRLAIERFEITGNARTSEAEILRQLGIAKGDNLFTADLGGARERLLRLPWAAGVAIERSFPQALRIALLEREPLALVDLGHLYLLDASGEVFKRALPGDPLDLPVITGLPRDEWQARPEETKARLDEALQALAAYGGRELGRTLPLSEVHLDPAEGVTLYLGDRGPGVKLGHGDFVRKLDRLERVLAEAKRRGDRLELVRLDNRARPGWIAARLSEGAARRGGARAPE